MLKLQIFPCSILLQDVKAVYDLRINFSFKKNSLKCTTKKTTLLKLFVVPRDTVLKLLSSFFERWGIQCTACPVRLWTQHGEEQQFNFWRFSQDVLKWKAIGLRYEEAKTTESWRKVSKHIRNVSTLEGGGSFKQMVFYHAKYAKETIRGAVDSSEFF